jgi:LysR family transcriptional regulator, low CO2-responsive transcriptional regulator
MLMESLFQQAGFRPNVGMEISSNGTIKQAVIAGLGIAFISAHTGIHRLNARDIVSL